MNPKEFPNVIPFYTPSMEAPLKYLPSPMKEIIYEVSEDVQTHPELVFAVALGHLSACAQGHVVLKVKETHFEHPCLFLLGNAPSGDNKSAIVKLLSLNGTDRSKLNYIDDATPEAVIQSMANANGLGFVLSDESTMLDQMCGKHGTIANMGNILKAYNGETINTDRITRDKVGIEKPFLTISILSQITILKQLFEKEEYYEKGLIPRLLFFVPTTKIGYREFSDYSTSPGTITAWQTCCSNILSLQDSGPVELVLDDDARCLFHYYRNKFEHNLRPGGDLASFKEWGSKLPGKLLRLAMLMHLANGGAPNELLIDDETVQNALSFDAFFINQAKRAFSLGITEQGRTQIGDLTYVLNKITAPEHLGSGTTFTRSELLEKCRGKKYNRTALDSLIQVLMEHNIIREIARDSRTDSVTYERNPAVTTGTTKALIVEE